MERGRLIGKTGVIKVHEHVPTEEDLGDSDEVVAVLSIVMLERQSFLERSYVTMLPGCIEGKEYGLHLPHFIISGGKGAIAEDVKRRTEATLRQL